MSLEDRFQAGEFAQRFGTAALTMVMGRFPLFATAVGAEPKPVGGWLAQGRMVLIRLPLSWWFVVIAAIVGGACSSKPGSDETAPVSAGERRAALDHIGAMVASLQPGDFDANTLSLVQGILALPQFAAAGSAADGSVWGRFRNGMMVVIAVTTTPESPLENPLVARAHGAPAAAHGVSATRPSVRARAVGPQATTAEPTVPNSNTFLLLNGFGGYFDAADPRPFLDQMLTANGYTGSMQDATLPVLRGSVHDLGILYFRTHGGIHARTSPDGDSEDHAALWTKSEVVDPDAEEADFELSEDLTFGRVVYMWARDDRARQTFDPNRPLPRFLEPNSHYGITDRFISQYMSFQPNAFAYIDACNSANVRAPLAHDLIAGFTAAGASSLAGWSEEASVTKMSEAARYVFDRLLGANEFVPETPKQRPFGQDALTRDPRFGFGKPFGWSKVSAFDASLVFAPLQGGFGLLAPSIYGLSVVEQFDELHIIGDFGPDPCGSSAGCADRSVTIDDGGGPVSLAVASWTPNVVRVGLPRTGAGSFGNVVVTLRGHRSNTRQLLGWRGTFVHSLADEGSLFQRFNLDVQLRMDPQDSRDGPGLAPKPTLFGLDHNNADMTAQFEAGGSASRPVGMCTFTLNWAGTGTLRSGEPANPRQYIYASQIDRPLGAMRLLFVAADPNGATALSVLACPPPTGSQNASAPLPVSASTGPFGDATGYLALPLDGALNIAGGNLQRSDEANRVMTLQWPSLSAKPSYDDSLPR